MIDHQSPEAMMILRNCNWKYYLQNITHFGSASIQLQFEIIEIDE